MLCKFSDEFVSILSKPSSQNIEVNPQNDKILILKYLDGNTWLKVLFCLLAFKIHIEKIHSHFPILHPDS